MFLGQVTENEYDSLGNLIYQKDRNGIVTRYQHDGLSRNIEKTNDKNGFLQYEYTDFGEVCGVTDGTAKQKVKYNAFGEVLEISRDKTSDFFEYDDEGRLTSKTIQDKDMGTVKNRYTYDKRGNVTSIETGMGVEYITYDKAGRITKKENSQSGIAKTYSYYPTGLVKDILTWQNDEVVYTESYEYDQNGNKIYEDLNGEIKRYAYDGMGRLKTVTDKDGNITEYEFDDFGNISKEYDISERGIKTKQYYYDSNNRLIMSDSPIETVQYEYDNAGNLLEKTTGYGGRIKKTFYRYDGYNRLSEYISGDVVSEYTYNLDGLRESKTVGGKYTRFMYDGMNIIGELCEGDYYIYHRGTELIGYQSYNGKSYYYRQDSHGNVTALLDFAGNEVKNYKYDAYGEPQGTRLNPAGDQTIIYQWKAETERVYNPFGFCGEYTDSESGLIYLRNRYYDPSTGRFINEDPIRDGLNWYVYCENNPIMFVDPWGLAIWLVHGTFNGTADNDPWVSTEFWTAEIQNYVSETFNNEPLYAEAWSGSNNKNAREKGAEELRDMIMTYINENGGLEDFDEPIRLVGHSHGGNVAILAANLLAEKGITVETLITIATPVRNDYQLDEGAVNQHINVYNTGDFVQARLGGKIQNIGKAGRTYSSAINVEVPKLPNRLWIVNRGIANHGFMHNNVSVWENYIVPKLE